MSTDISPDFRYDALDAEVISRLLKHEATPRAVRMFSNECHKLTDYGYWFLLGTLWVSYTGFSDLSLWRRLLSASRPNRQTSLMKPSEVEAWRSLPDEFSVFRAHRPGETDWLSYTIDAEKAAWFAWKRGVSSVSEYRLKRDDAICLFLRRGESEVLALDTAVATFVQQVKVVVTPNEAVAFA